MSKSVTQHLHVLQYVFCCFLVFPQSCPTPVETSENDVDVAEVDEITVSYKRNKKKKEEVYEIWLVIIIFYEFFTLKLFAEILIKIITSNDVII